MRLLVTRPEPDGEPTAAELRKLGHSVVLAPLLRFEPIACEFGTGPWAGVIFTSANAVRALSHHPRLDALLGLRAFAVGDRTASAARDLGFTRVYSVAADARALVKRLSAEAKSFAGPLLYPAAEQRAADIGDRLAGRGIAVRTVTAYRMVAVAALAADIQAALASGAIDGVLHFSARSAQAYVESARAAGALVATVGVTHYCLSEQVAAPLQMAGMTDVRIAEHPDQRSLLRLVGPN